jgi:fumarate reductase subunit C
MAQPLGRRPFRREVPRVTWFLRHPRYVRYMVREITCFFIGGFTVLLIIGLVRLAEGQAAYESFITSLQSPIAILFLGATFFCALYHSVTWFNLTPRAMPLQIGERFLPDSVIAGAHYAAWMAISVLGLMLAGVLR